MCNFEFHFFHVRFTLTLRFFIIRSTLTRHSPSHATTIEFYYRRASSQICRGNTRLGQILLVTTRHWKIHSSLRIASSSLARSFTLAYIKDGRGGFQPLEWKRGNEYETNMISVVWILTFFPSTVRICDIRKYSRRSQ